MGFSWETKPNRTWCVKLPTYEISINGKPKKVELTKIGEKTFKVKLEDKTFNAEIPTDKIEFGKEFQIKIDDEVYAVTLEGISRTKPFTVKVDEAPFKAELKTPVKKPLLTAAEQLRPTLAMKTTKPKPSVSGAVTAPMTGKIISIKVEKGEQVKAGQVLCILEAMKMENEITAPTGGTIQEIFVFEGSSVNEGDPLFVIG